jgi:hypothetical protein
LDCNGIPENNSYDAKIKKLLSVTDDVRRTLVETAMAMGRDLMEQIVSIVSP